MGHRQAVAPHRQSPLSKISIWAAILPRLDPLPEPPTDRKSHPQGGAGRRAAGEAKPLVL